MRIPWLRPAGAYVLGGLMVGVGYEHFHSAAPFVSIVPKFLPHPLALVLISGFFEMAGGVGLLVPATRRSAAIGLIALYLAVFPANINMAVNNLPLNGQHFPPWTLWLRLPLQIVLIAWAYWCADIGRKRPS